MIQRRTLSENIEPIHCAMSRSDSCNGKVTIKEKKAAKRKEKSRVAAQIRRNKESQTLILLQNALPLALPSQNQMLEKSIVIRIAGQTLFLMNTLDQVLGMDGWLTIPLTSNNFLTFFMDSMGQIVYASPNIQLLLEQHHWSNLIGMSISDVVESKSRWPTVGEAVRLKLSTSHIIGNESSSFSPSSSTNSPPTSSRSAIASKLNFKKNSQVWNCSSSTCSLYNVWCWTNISHTNSKLKLLILQAVQIKSSILNNTKQEISKHSILSKTTSLSLERSISWPSMSSAIRREPQEQINVVHNLLDETDPSPNKSSCIYQRMITSAHDQYYHFRSASAEFCQLIGETPNSVINFNFLDIVHLEDVIKVKSFLDLIMENNDNHIWTPVYRVMCRNGHQCVLRTLAKYYCTTASQSLVLNHLVIKSSQICEDFISENMFGLNQTFNHQENFLSSKTITPKTEMFIIRPDTDSGIITKRKSSDEKRVVSCEKYPRLVDRTMSSPMVLSNIYVDTSVMPLRRPPKSNVHRSKGDYAVKHEMLSYDPFMPMDHESARRSRKGLTSPDDDSRPAFMNKHKPPRLHSKLDSQFNRSPSCSLESCVLTSPGSECTEVPLDDQFIWDIAGLNSWLDEHYQNDLELILPL